MKEHDEQRALFQWASECVSYNIHPELALMFAIPNAQVALKMISSPRIRFSFIQYMTSEGRKKGVPDIFLAVPRRTYHGLFVEMKAEKGKLSPEQKEWIKQLNEQGYLAQVCVGCQQAQELIEWYLNDKENRDMP